MTENSLPIPEKAEPLIVNGRSYGFPSRPVVVICFDGCDPAYLAAASAAGAIPTLTAMMQTGFHGEALAAMPTFTNPNNVAIVCGAPPAVTGVSGNYYLDRATGREIMVLDGHQMRTDTILARFAAAGLRVGVVTAKDKLLRALAHGLEGIALSAESPDDAVAALGPIDGRTAAPNRYSADLSLFVLDCGALLVGARRCDLLFLSLSDYVQHKHAPTEPEAIAFMAEVDHRIGRIVDAGAVVGIVADHGMSDMADEAGLPRVVYIQDVLEAQFGPGVARVICPIADPFTRHHASLGGLVRVYLAESGPTIEQARGFLAGLDGVGEALTGPAACARFDLPVDGEGDVVVIAAPGVALGSSAHEHDLGQLVGQRLRSHGGTAEQPVPFILSHPLSADYQRRAASGLHNFDIFDYALNGACP